MTERIKNIALFIVISITVNIISILLKSDYIILFLDNNLILIIIALMAINTTTISIIMAKLRELVDKYGGNFKKSMIELKVSICEQVWLIIISTVSFILKHSQVIKSTLPYQDFIFKVIVVTIFCYAIYILYDTANAVFVILKFEDDDSE